ncbi:4-hydroxybenzoate polyprenyltransferase, mitochondrial-like isoform X2 [Physella acuta]|uniref:4-hydroxybenzoate polyprenyltransferase, mitochondrial-like isoform X2 n=1 Tax=Physella acuta TaxID=109671 RepID=UPI0027DEA997|nr:4-hydroxybenzoate polyprenyltransferase, mitochondrial-like isoform X2 [Physella acuta]
MAATLITCHPVCQSLLLRLIKSHSKILSSCLSERPKYSGFSREVADKRHNVLITTSRNLSYNKFQNLQNSQEVLRDSTSQLKPTSPMSYSVKHKILKHKHPAASIPGINHLVSDDTTSPTPDSTLSCAFIHKKSSTDYFQRTHHNFSTTRLIVESSPLSFQPYLRLIRFDKPIGTWLLYWPCTWSIALAAQPGCMPDLKLLALFGAGAFFMRGAGCIINDMWDKDFDAKVARTKTRPLASGEITYFQALLFLSTQLTCALVILLQLNYYSIVLGVASMGLVVIYPLCKRFTYWPQIILGLTLNWGVLLAWATLQGSVELAGFILYCACTLYTVIYDTLYSHQDKYDDMLIGVKSTAIRLGDQTKPWMSAFTAVMAGGLIGSGMLCDMLWPYYVAVGITAGRLAQQIYCVDLDNADDCASAFRGNFYLGGVMFLGIVFANLLKAKEKEKVATSDDS